MTLLPPLQRAEALKENISVQIPPRSALLKVVLCLVETAIEEIDKMIQGVRKYNNT